jgi:uncharacterized membrane protein
LASYTTRVTRDIQRWVEQGLIAPDVAERLTRDIQANERQSLSFGSILAMMAALLFAAAILVLVAANWEAIPRLVRVAALFAAILAGYVGGALLKLRDHAAIGEGLYVIAAAAFGASIALIGQMYHMSGDEASAIITWSVGTGIAALALRSGPLTIASVGIAAAWLFLVTMGYWGSGKPFPYGFILLAALLWLVSYWTRSVVARHLILLSLILYAAMLIYEFDAIAVALSLALVSALLFAAAVFAPARVEVVARLDGHSPVYGFLGFLVGMMIIQGEMVNDTPQFALAAGVTFAGIAAAVVLAGRESRGLRWIAYLAFGIELVFVYIALVGTMLGTAGLFFASGIVLGLVALIIIRLEKRMFAEPAVPGATS